MTTASYVSFARVQMISWRSNLFAALHHVLTRFAFRLSPSFFSTTVFIFSLSLFHSWSWLSLSRPLVYILITCLIHALGSLAMPLLSWKCIITQRPMPGTTKKSSATFAHYRPTGTLRHALQYDYLSVAIVKVTRIFLLPARIDLRRAFHTTIRSMVPT